MYRNFVEVTVAEQFNDDTGTTMFVGLIKIGTRHVWEGDPKFHMEGAYTQAEAVLGVTLRELIEKKVLDLKRAEQRKPRSLSDRPRVRLDDGD